MWEMGGRHVGSGRAKIWGDITIGSDEWRLRMSAGDHGSCAYLGGRCSILTAIMVLSNLLISVM